MPEFIKHVGQVNSTGKKCVVVFREIPGATDSCLVVETETLPQLYHDDVISAIESAAAQEDMDFFKYATRSTLHDGRNMLEAMHLSGWMKKLPTSEVTMLPTREIKISLHDLNKQLASLNKDGRTTSGDISADEEPSTPAGVLDDTKIANQMRSQAAFFHKEAQRLLAEAEALDPSKTKTTVKETVTAEPEVKVKRKYTKKK
jgi:hypothetical protein